QRGDRVLQHPLDSGPAGLALESQEIRAVIGYDTADGSHRNRHPTTAKSVSDPTSTAQSAALNRLVRQRLRPADPRQQRDSKARARPSARRNALINSGTSTGTSDRTRRMGPPVSKSAPRAFWAFIIRSSSPARVGMKRRAMLIISAISWFGTPTRRPGASSHSKASVIATGEVVKVTTDTPAASNTSRAANRPPVSSPSAVT